MREKRFNFEDLEIWQKSVDFAVKTIDLTEEIKTDRKHYRLVENLESAATSVALNISEGKGRFSKKEFLQFLRIAKGSLFETVTFLIIFERKKWISASQLETLEVLAEEIGKKISALINSIKDSLK